MPGQRSQSHIKNRTMVEYTRKDIICFTDDPRLENAIGKKVYAADSPTILLILANDGNPDLWCETLTAIHNDANSRPFTTYAEDSWNTGYNNYDVIIINKEET